MVVVLVCSRASHPTSGLRRRGERLQGIDKTRHDEGVRSPVSLLSRRLRPSFVLRLSLALRLSVVLRLSFVLRLSYVLMEVLSALARASPPKARSRPAGASPRLVFGLCG